MSSEKKKKNTSSICFVENDKYSRDQNVQFIDRNQQLLQTLLALSCIELIYYG